MAKNYYDILGVSKNASQDEIKKAFRNLSKQYHPDRKARASEEEKKEAEAKFKEINEAYSVLSDSEKKNMYDTYGTVDPSEMGGAGFDPFGGFNPFGEGFNPFAGMHRQQNIKGEDLHITIDVDFDDLFRGVTKKVKVKQKVRCKHCSGSGSTTGSIDVCPHCQGSGMIMKTTRRGNMIMQQSSPCPHCNGTGEVVRDKCPHCVDGLVTEEVEITVDIPAGMYGDGAQMLERGRGHYAPRRKGPQGDLIIAIVEIPSSKGLKRDDKNNLLYTKRVDYWTMVEGGEVNIPYIGNDIKINVTPGSESGKKVTLYRKGFADPNKRQPNADYIVTLECYVPDVRYMTDEQKAAIEALKKSFS